jgi:epoxyqueuosine reductase
MPISTSDSRRAAKLTAFVKAEAARLGFSECRITRPDKIGHAGEGLACFVDAQHHGTMQWMEETLERRADPRVLWADVQTVIVLAMNYGPDDDPLATLEKPECGSISVYARNRDYHDVIKGKLKELASKLVSRSGEDVKVFVDTAPVMEKPLAQAAGLGWQGKHTNLVSRNLGSWFFLASIFTTAALTDSTTPKVSPNSKLSPTSGSSR